jgi:alkane 1-monooxygenase
MPPWGFLSFLFFFVICCWSLLSPNYLFIPIVYVFVITPVMDFFIQVDRRNPTQIQEQSWRKTLVWAIPLYIYFFSHFTLLLIAVSAILVNTSIINYLLISLVCGLYTGGLGITVAHELCHKKEKIHQIFADLLLASVMYQHFAVEHVRGHHLHVATVDDPASARLNENVFQFLFRSIKGSFLHAFVLDRKRVLYGIFLALIFASLALFLGLKVLLFFILQAIVAFVLLEMVNYVEHYGLERKILSNGRYEKVTPIHSWNSSHKFSNYMLFNLQRHSDHHAWAHLPYTVLKHHDQAPQLPAGYPSMILLALVPPLWFKFMNPRVKASTYS